MMFCALAAAAATSTVSRAITQTGSCKAPFSCVHLHNVPIPSPQSSECLIRVNASSVNPSDVDTAESGGCKNGCGADVSGTIIKCNGGDLKPGDAVWTLAQPAYSDYVAQPVSQISRRPTSLDHHHAGTLPEVGLTSLFSLKRTIAPPGTALPHGSPWNASTYPNLTVAVTAGAGGTGMIGLQLAKAWGAKHIATSTTGAAGEAFVRSLGADIVFDYHKVDMFDALPDNSVDIGVCMHTCCSCSLFAHNSPTHAPSPLSLPTVYDNYGAPNTAEKAMRVIRPGGVYLLMPHGICYALKLQRPPCLAKHPKPGVTQLNYDTGPDFGANMKAGLDELAELVESGKVIAPLDKTFAFEKIASAFNYSAGPGEGGVSGGHHGKISVVMSA